MIKKLRIILDVDSKHKVCIPRFLWELIINPNNDSNKLCIYKYTGNGQPATKYIICGHNYDDTNYTLFNSYIIDDSGMAIINIPEDILIEGNILEIEFTWYTGYHFMYMDHPRNRCIMDKYREMVKASMALYQEIY